MKGKFGGTIYLITAVLALVGVLMVMNRVPLMLDKGIIRKYASVEEAASAAGMKGLSMPSYFPRDIQWPPSEVIAASRPSKFIVMEFLNRLRGDVSMIIMQGEPYLPPLDEKMKFKAMEKTKYALKGRNAVLELGTCKEEKCSRICWNEDENRKISILMKAPPVELIKVAESIVK